MTERKTKRNESLEGRKDGGDGRTVVENDLKAQRAAKRKQYGVNSSQVEDMEKERSQGKERCALGILCMWRANLLKVVGEKEHWGERRVGGTEHAKRWTMA